MVSPFEEQDGHAAVTAPGQQSGQGPGGLDWGSYLQALVDERGSLSAVANHLAAQRGYEDDLASIERGLRRLRGRGNRDGGVWGRRLLTTFGLPRTVVDRVRWMGFYHSRFTDLPTSVCRELLLLWDRPPVSESSARAYVQLGLASVALRLREHAAAAEHLEQAARAGGATDARIEHALMRSYLVARDDARESSSLLDSVEQLLDGEPDSSDRSCFFARLVDQRAYPLNKPRPRQGEPDHEAALALYQRIPDDGPPFARCRRHNGMGWSLLLLGRTAMAVDHARISVREAGDCGSLRLRAMALNLLHHALVDDARAAEDASRRAARIAARLEDEELLGRYASHVAA